MATAVAAVVYGPVGIGLTQCERLLREVLVDRDSTIQWCKDAGLLAHSMTCHGCGGEMKWEVTTEAKVDGCRLVIVLS